MGSLIEHGIKKTTKTTTKEVAYEKCKNALQKRIEHNEN